MKPLSKREAQALEFIRQHIQSHGRAPYQHEIMTHLGGTSRGFVQRMLKSMAQKGAISTMPCVPGSITIRGDGVQAPIQVSLRDDIRSALDLISIAAGADASTIIAEWVSERVAYELRSKAVAA